MRLELSRSAATAGLLAALTARTFYGLALDAPEVMNAAWLAAPIGAVLSLPVVWLMANRRSRFMSAVLFVFIALDAAEAVEWTAFSESCLAFNHVSPVLLMLPLLLAALRCAWLGGDAVGGTARIWTRLFALLLLMVILLQLPYYNPRWLTPILGAGTGGILRAGIRAAGLNALLCLSTGRICRERLGLQDLLPGLLLASCVSALLTLLRQMMAPVMTGAILDRQMRLDALLTNGRAPLTLQLPMIVAWFTGLMHLIAFEGVAACALLRRAFPGMKEGRCMALGLGAVSALALSRAPRMAFAQGAFSYLYHVLAGGAVILWTIQGGRKRARSV